MNAATEAAATNAATVITNGSIEKSAVGLDLGREAAVWSRERIDLIKKTVCPAGIPDNDFLLFIEQCKRTALDPLIKEAFCVRRNLNIGKKDAPNWVTKFEFQPAEAGMAARADRFTDFGGIRCGVVYEGDEVSIDESTGVVSHKSNPITRVGKKILGAWAHCIRAGRALPVEWCDFGAYNQGVQQWVNKPATMIAKCARAAAYRRAYPNVFGGLYIREEEVEEVEVNAPPAEPGKSKTQTVADKVKAKAAEGRPTPPPPASGQTVDAKKPEPGTVIFGGEGVKGKLITSFTTTQLAELIRQAEEKLIEVKDAEVPPTWVVPISMNLADIKEEFSKRDLLQPVEAEKKRREPKLKVSEEPK